MVRNNWLYCLPFSFKSFESWPEAKEHLYFNHLSMTWGFSISTMVSKAKPLNGLRKIICLRKSENSVERISVCSVLENLAERGVHCLPCFCTNDVIDLLW